MKHYLPGFKAEAVALYRSRPGATIAHIADDLEINRETLRSRVRINDGKKVSAHKAKPTAATAADDEDLATENTLLRKRIRELEEERDILRKAACSSPGRRAGEPLPVRRRPSASPWR